MATTDELLDILMKDYKKPEDLIGDIHDQRHRIAEHVTS